MAQKKADPTKKLRREFNTSLERLWQAWDGFSDTGTPFDDLDAALEMEVGSAELATFYYDLGRVESWNKAFGWPIHRPGPREWSPRG